MKATAIFTAVPGILLAGCIMLAGCGVRGNTAKNAPGPPPPPLSIPQTRVALPKPQPVDPAALAETTTPDPPTAAASPARQRRVAPSASSLANPPAAGTAPAEPRGTVQEIISPAELRRLRDRTQALRREVNQILDQLGRRQMSSAQQNESATIRSFLALSEQAEKYNDPRQADALAERAQILAKELQSGK